MIPEDLRMQYERIRKSSRSDWRWALPLFERIGRVEAERDLIHGMEAMTRIAAQCRPALSSVVRVWNAWKRNLSARQAALAELNKGWIG